MIVSLVWAPLAMTVWTPRVRSASSSDSGALCVVTLEPQVARTDLPGFVAVGPIQDKPLQHRVSWQRRHSADVSGAEHKEEG